MARETSLAEDVTRQALLDSPDDTETEQPAEEQPQVQIPQEPVQLPVEQPVSRGQASWLNNPTVDASGNLIYTEPPTQPEGPQPAGGGEVLRAQAVVTGPADLPESTDQIQVTHYGYAGDQSWDENSGKGIGDSGNQLIPGFSTALTRSGRQALLGVDSDKSTGQEFTYGGRKYRDDDTAPQSNPRLDVYDPVYQGLDEGVTKEMADARRKLSPAPAYDVKAQPIANLEGTGDTTGVANFFSKRGDDPIASEDDPRLTTVSVGDQKWPVNREAAPYFQGFLNDLASAGAPIRSDGGWVYRNIAGTDVLSQHAYGGAIDVSSEGRNQVTPEFGKWLDNNPGVLGALENKWHIYGGERFGDLSHFEWGGVSGGGGAPTAKELKAQQAQQLVPAQAAPKTAAWLESARVVSPEENRYLIDQANQKDAQQIAQLSDQFKGEQSLPGLINKLDQPIPGVPDHVRLQLQQQATDQLIKDSQSYFNEPDPQKALAQGMSNAGPFSMGDNFWRKVLGGAQEYWLTGRQAQMPYNTAKTDINSFFAKVGMNDAQQHEFITQMNMMPVDQREKMIASMLPPSIPGVTLDVNQPSTNPSYLARAFDKLNDPKWEQQQQQEVADMQAKIDHNLQTDPRLKGTGAEAVTNVGAMVADGVASLNPAGYPALAAKVNDQLKAQVKTEHPDWTDEQVQRAATYGTLSAVLGQIGAFHVFGAVAEPLLNAVKTPVTRLLARIGAGAAGGAPIMAGGQALTNVLTGAPAGRGVVEAGVMGGLLGGAGGALHGPGEYRPGFRAEAPLEHPEPLGPPAPLAEPEPRPYGPPAYPPFIPRGEPLIGAEITGPEATETAPLTAREPVITRLGEGERVITPSILRQAMSELPENATTEQLRQRIEQIQGAELEAPRGVYFQPGEELQQPGIVRQVGEDPLTAFAREQGRGTIPRETIQEGRQVQPVRQPAGTQEQILPSVQGRIYEGMEKTPERGQGIPYKVGEPITPEGIKPRPGIEPWRSEIANKFVQPKVEPGEIPPGTSVSARELINRGLEMSPEEINKHVSDIMHGPDSEKQSSAVLAQQAALDRTSARLSEIAEKMALNDPSKQQALLDAENARKDWLDFTNGPVAKMKNMFHQFGRALQGQHDIDLSTFDGIKKQWLKDMTDPLTDKVKRQPTADEEQTMRRTANAVKGAKAVTDDTLNGIDKVIKGRKIISDEEAIRRIAEKMGDLGFPCRV